MQGESYSWRGVMDKVGQRRGRRSLQVHCQSGVRDVCCFRFLLRLKFLSSRYHFLNFYFNYIAWGHFSLQANQLKQNTLTSEELSKRKTLTRKKKTMIQKSSPMLMGLLWTLQELWENSSLCWFEMATQTFILNPISGT